MTVILIKDIDDILPRALLIDITDITKTWSERGIMGYVFYGGFDGLWIWSISSPQMRHPGSEGIKFEGGSTNSFYKFRSTLRLDRCGWRALRGRTRYAKYDK
jgi:hypothetical protein